MRGYARAGFALRPCVGAVGTVGREGLGAVGGVREAGPEGAERAAALWRAIRGGASAEDVAWLLAHGARLLVAERDRGFCLHRDGALEAFAAHDEDAAARLLTAALAEVPAGEQGVVPTVTAGQDWAVEVALRAGLALRPWGPLFVRGRPGPLRPYLPSGDWL
jgi:hypothetical protein